MKKRHIKFILKATDFVLLTFILFPFAFYINRIYGCDSCHLNFIQNFLKSISSYLIKVQVLAFAPALVAFFIPFSIAMEWVSGSPREWKLTMYIACIIGLITLMYVVFT
ncbi:hypothetical protein AUK11_02100 [bacterium CG2_30_37_16]|nr:MAG: hypothetical protein AUK11_02100 [bacterium CG2_30_37_16]PIP30788.1 MAG: hypothetical protein COX25_02935 [bacterium (Candidatus Howlettbacteria) CG23_combo_of_CG06-09_8_20_14_all_37_9]PIY00322.1 MAG: hypothetical protein COZ22_00525 [bacterium (Candidatus Howlettbacteria) CG_4_10_14_3_um_filter_37_10]PJB06398.1 MAG: hypothetical protein CO123_02245 [bacterium (Candidatus Howlettbacteria) CG_4_9_14_3_um_filter_37_10]